MLIIPIMRRISRHPLRVYVRQAPSTAPPDFDNWSTGSSNSILFDIRVKVLAESVRTSSTSSDAPNKSISTAKWNPVDYWKSQSVSSSSLSSSSLVTTTNQHNTRLFDQGQGSAQNSINSSRNNSISDRMNATMTVVDIASDERNHRVLSSDATGSSSYASNSTTVISTFTSSLLSMVPTTWAAKLGIGYESTEEGLTNTNNESLDALVSSSSSSLYSTSDKDDVSNFTSTHHQNTTESMQTTSQLVYTSLSDVSNSSSVKTPLTTVNTTSPPRAANTGQQRADLIAAKLAALRKQS